MTSELRVAQIVAPCCCVAAIVLQWCQMAFGLFRGAVWYDPTVFTLMLGFLVAELWLLRQYRAQRRER